MNDSLGNALASQLMDMLGDLLAVTRHALQYIVA
jgi:hypothetical protein